MDLHYVSAPTSQRPCDSSLLGPRPPQSTVTSSWQSYCPCQIPVEWNRHVVMRSLGFVNPRAVSCLIRIVPILFDGAKSVYHTHRTHNGRNATGPHYDESRNPCAVRQWPTAVAWISLAQKDPRARSTHLWSSKYLECQRDSFDWPWMLRIRQRSNEGKKVKQILRKIMTPVFVVNSIRQYWMK